MLFADYYLDRIHLHFLNLGKLHPIYISELPIFMYM